jgi:hypothetical protein
MTTSDYPETNENEVDSEWFGDSAHYWTDESLRFAYVLVWRFLAMNGTRFFGTSYLRMTRLADGG